MSDWMGLPDEQIEHAARERRLTNLERRAPFFSEPAPSLGCCTAYCCTEQLFDQFEVGEIVDLCSTTIEPVGGNGVRIEASGWVSIGVIDSGAMSVRCWIDVDGTEYLGSPQFGMTLAGGDSFTIPFGNTIDVTVPDPTITVRVQSLATPTLMVMQVYSRFGIVERDGSPACGEPAGQ